MLSDDFNLRLTSEAYIKGSIPWTESLVRSALNLKSEAAITPMGILAFEWMLVFKNTIDLFNYGRLFPLILLFFRNDLDSTMGANYLSINARGTSFTYLSPSTYRYNYSSMHAIRFLLRTVN